jgi:hypothetical protein
MAPGFGKQPQSQNVRVSVVGQASPRWRAAGNTREADHLNETLSNERAEAARLVVEQLLRQQLPGVKIEPGVSRPAGQHGDAEIELGSYAVGSRDALVRTGGYRQSNDAIDRSVKISIELITTHYGQSGRSLPPGKIPAYTKFWYLRVTRLTVDPVGVAFGEVDLTLRNSLSDKTMKAHAFLYGGGVNLSPKSKYVDGGTNLDQLKNSFLFHRLGQRYKDIKGREEVSFSTNKEMGFDDFNNQLVRVGMAAAYLVGGIGNRQMRGSEAPSKYLILLRVLAK